jgi:hypothetical protein
MQKRELQLRFTCHCHSHFWSCVINIDLFWTEEVKNCSINYLLNLHLGRWRGNTKEILTKSGMLHTLTQCRSENTATHCCWDNVSPLSVIYQHLTFSDYLSLIFDTQINKISDKQILRVRCISQEKETIITWSVPLSVSVFSFSFLQISNFTTMSITNRRDLIYWDTRVPLVSLSK